MKTHGLLSTFIAVLPVALWAADAPEHGKPATGDPSPVDPGRWELEVTYGSARAGSAWDAAGRRRSRPARDDEAWGLAYTRGLCPNWDFTLVANYLRLRDDEMAISRSEGASDASASFRYRFLNDERRTTEAAVSFGFTAPTGERCSDDAPGLTQRCWSYNLATVATRDWGMWTANAELGLSAPVDRSTDDPYACWIANCAIGCQTLKTLQPTLELNCGGDWAPGPDAENVAITAGLVMPLPKGMRAILAYRHAIHGRSSDRDGGWIAAFKLAF